jgi:hypothetical protein
VVQRYLASRHRDASAGSCRDLESLIDGSAWALDEDERGSLLQRLAEVLATGDFHYVVAAQRFTPTMQVSLEYLNQTTRYGRYFLVEIIQLAGAELTAHAAQVVAAPPRRSMGQRNDPTTQADESAFMAGLPEGAYRDAVRDLLASCSALGLEVKWRSGASIRFETPDRRQPLSIGWLLPDGSQSQGARYVTFGVDPGSLAQTPSVAEGVRSFVQRLSEVPGARPTPSKLDAYTFGAQELPAALPQLLPVLEQLVADVMGR